MSKQQERYEVEWCTRYAIDERGDHDFDSDEMSVQDFRTLEEAKRFAHTLTPEGWGLVQIRRKVLVEVECLPGEHEWEYVGEAIEIDRPWKEPAAT